jgi:DNA-binding XRE family transcriptional regulator
MKNKRNKIITFEEHLEKEYGNKNSPKRVKYEQEYEAFKLGVMLQELRKENNLTQEQLADKCGTTKNYISRIENDASDIRLSTLMRILKEGFGGQLNFVLKFN